MGRPDLWDDADAAKALTAEYANVRDDVATYDALARCSRTSRCSTSWPARRTTRRRSPRSPTASPRSGAASTSSICAACSPASTTRPTPSSRSTPRTAASTPRTGAEMLLRMYERWAERRGFKFGVDGVSEGTEAGILSAEFTLTGRYAYGLMTSERGTHRLVRISPFDNQGRRQTSFAAVQVWPVMDDPRRRARRVGHPHGGLPGLRRRRPARQQDVVGGAPDPRADRLVASSQEERSQLQNREKALGRLKAMVAAKVEEERGRRARRHRRQAGPGRLGQPDPLLRAAAVPDGQGPAHRDRVGQRRRRPRRRPRRVHGGLPPLEAAPAEV